MSALRRAIAQRRADNWRFRGALHRYPRGWRRALHLVVVVLVVGALYYQLLLGVGLSARVLAGYDMSFGFFLDATAVGFVLGGVLALATGLTDRFGRTNVIAIGLLLVSLLSLLGIPFADTEAQGGVVLGALGLVEGAVLVATVSLVRDLTPQAGRATGMALWGLGPALGAIAVSIHVRETNGKVPFEDYYTIAGAIGVVVAAVAGLVLRDLAIELRGQAVAQAHDRPLLMKLAGGIDVEGAQQHALRRTARPRVLAAAIGIALLLMAYWATLVFLPTYFQDVLGFSGDETQGLAVWTWGAHGIALLVVAVLSDRLRVRKPFLLLGAAGAITCTVLLAFRTTHVYTDYSTFRWLLVGLGASFGAVLAPWAAGFSETVEHDRPALVGTAFGWFGLVGRVVLAAILLVMPVLVPTTNALVDEAPIVKRIATGTDPLLTAAQNKAVAAAAGKPSVGTKAQHDAARYADELDLVDKLPPAVAIAVRKKPTDPDAQAGALAVFSGLKKPDVATVLKIEKKYVKELKTAALLDPDTLTALVAHPDDAKSVSAAARELVGGPKKVTEKAARKKLRALRAVPNDGLHLVLADRTKVDEAQATLKKMLKIPLAVLTFFAGHDELRDTIVQDRIIYLAEHRPDVSDARADAPDQWRTFLLVAAGGELLFVPTIFFLLGRWLPWRARRDRRAHAADVDRQLAELSSPARADQP